MKTLLMMFVGSGLLLVIPSQPLLLSKVGPNNLYGFRVPSTVSNRELWYPMNTYAARWLLGVGVATSISASLFYQVPGISTDTYAIAVAVVSLGGLAGAAYFSFRYLEDLKRRSARQNGG